MRPRPRSTMPPRRPAARRPRTSTVPTTAAWRTLVYRLTDEIVHLRAQLLAERHAHELTHWRAEGLDVGGEE